MDRLGPFDSAPHLTAAVSGGADSMALAVLARDWLLQRGGRLTALIVDHGLRPESGQEAQLTRDRLAALAIPARILPLTELQRGPALAERARKSRYAALIAACRQGGCRHLLVAHQAGDQVETVAMRVLRGSRNDGLAGMSALRETGGVRLLRPLLGVHPARLRTYLAKRGIPWVEDPSNRDMKALRPRLRQGLSEASWDALLSAVAAAGERRAQEETAAAAWLSEHVVVYPEGYALVRTDQMPPRALSALVSAIAGADYPPDPDIIAGLAAHLASATLHGARIMPAGRLGTGWLVVREEAFIQPCTAAAPAVLWDNRFALSCDTALPGDAMISALGEATIGALADDAAGFRRLSSLPSVVLRTLPALRIGKMVAAVPHLRYGGMIDTLEMAVTFAPPRPVDSPAFLPSLTGFLGRAEPAGIRQDDDPGGNSPPVGQPSAGVGMQRRVPHTIYQGAASGPPNHNQPDVTT